MDPTRCRLCGNPGKLTPEGVCEWEGGCEHRRMKAAAAAARFDADYRFHFERLVCGHTPAEHAEQVRRQLGRWPGMPYGVEPDFDPIDDDEP